MSTTAFATPMDEPIVPASAVGWRSRFDALLTAVLDRFNPILVKEARQALKSRYFAITFGLVLFAAWLVTVYFVTTRGSSLELQYAGRDLFFAYYLILAAALFVVVPFTAFRSLAVENEDRTFELLAISTLSPRQIVAGKLASAALQILVYFSAMAPCLAFTYLLRGIDVPTIAVALVYTFLISLAECALALLVATLSEKRHWQIVLSVLLICAMVLLLILTCEVAFGLLYYGREFVSPDAWLGHMLLALLLVSSFIVVFLAAAARITFPSDNRATPLRIATLLQSLLIVGWAFAMTSFFTQRYHEPMTDFMYPAVIMWSGYWFICGSIMVGEPVLLSPRVRRALPDTSLGRALWSWFQPGSGRGYLFALMNTLGGTLAIYAMTAVWSGVNYGSISRGYLGSRVSLGGLMALVVCYVTFYLGLARLILAALRRRGWEVDWLLAFVVQLLLLITGSVAPILVNFLFGVREFNFLLITNPIWTLIEGFNGSQNDFTASALVCSMLAIPVFLLNMPSLIEELRGGRLPKPLRLLQEEEALKPPPLPVKTSPWD